MALDIMPTSFWRRRFERALVGQALLAENIEAVSQGVVNDLGDDLLCGHLCLSGLPESRGTYLQARCQPRGGAHLERFSKSSSTR